AVFSAIRYKDIVEQNALLKNEIAELKKSVKRIADSLNGEKEIVELPATDSENVAPQYPVGADTAFKSKMEKLEGELTSLNEKVETYQQQANTSRAAAPDLGDSTFQETINKAVQKTFMDNFGKRSEASDKRMINVLEEQLRLSPVQKEAIGKILEEKRAASRELWRKNMDDTNITVQQSMQQSQQISDEAENKIKTYLDSSQLAKYNQLKESGELDEYRGWGGRGGPDSRRGGRRRE
ncbi:hypothetical protein HY605_00870, partial [Candidatus Peregrinibacteria bacterium]|nr:hypothetical protein [Candidatus Peregrinibacteria bacterium]